MNGLIEEREMQPSEKVLPELSRLAADAVGTNAEALLQDALVRANVPDPASATPQHLFATIDQLEHSMASLLDPERAGQVATAMRERTRQILG
jgi:hypothetical protein